LGGALLRSVEQRLPGQVQELWLQVAPSDVLSLRFYARHGFREAHREQAPGGDTVHLVKRRGRRGAAARLRR